VVKVASASAYEQGLEAVANYRYAAALMHFQVAAEQGDRSARRNLGLMQLYGELLYGNEVPRNQEQARRWLEAAAADGCEVSAFMVKTLAQHAH
jgi:TPR repeat protein